MNIMDFLQGKGNVETTEPVPAEKEEKKTVVKVNLDPPIEIEEETEERGITEVPSGAPPPAVLDLSQALGQATEIFSNQVAVALDDSSDVMDIQTSRDKSDSVIETMHNVREIIHIQDIAQNIDSEFKRKDELAALNPLLRAHTKAAIIAEKQIDWVGRLHDAMEDEARETGSIDIERLVAVQNGFGIAIENMHKVGQGTAKVVETQRKSGLLAYENRKPKQGMQVMKYSDNGGRGGKGGGKGGEPIKGKEVVPRDVSKAELAKMLGQ